MGGCPQPAAARTGGVHAASVQCARTELPPAAARTLPLSGAPTPSPPPKARQQMRTEPRRNLPQAGDRGAAASPLARPIGLGDPHLTRRPRPGTLPRIGRNPGQVRFQVDQVYYSAEV